MSTPGRQLYAIYLGGDPAPGRIGEDHEVVFVVAEDVISARRQARANGPVTTRSLMSTWSRSSTWWTDTRSPSPRPTGRRQRSPISLTTRLPKSPIDLLIDLLTRLRSGHTDAPAMSFLDERAALAGKVALVAGGGGGLGRAVALDFARAGMDLALCDRDADALASTAPKRATSERRSQKACSMSATPTRSAAFFEITDGAFDRLDVLVNVVGGTFRSDFLDVNAKGVDTLIRTNFTWVTEAIRLAATRMAASGGAAAS